VVEAEVVSFLSAATVGMPLAKSSQCKNHRSQESRPAVIAQLSRANGRGGHGHAGG
jgi:hypothetical protein